MSPSSSMLSNRWPIELHGRDVNVLHRLLKNDVTSDTGITAYAIFTQQAVEALGLEATA